MGIADRVSPEAARRAVDRPLARYAILGAGTLASVVAVLPVLPFLASDRGVLGPTSLDAAHPVSAGVALALGAALCCAVACAVGRLINAAVGLFVLGCGLAAVAGRSGTIVDAAFDADALLPVAVETLCWAAAVAAMSALVFRASGPLIDMPARSPKGSFAGEAFNADSLRGMAAGVVAVAAMWLVLRTEMKGQAIGAAVVGGVATAFLGRRALGPAQPILLAAAPVLAVGLAQLWTALTLKAPLDQAVAARAIPGWSMAMPIDVAAGALIGVPLGLGWSKPAEHED